MQAVKQLMELVGSTTVQQAGLSVMNTQKGTLPHGWAAPRRTVAAPRRRAPPPRHAPARHAPARHATPRHATPRHATPRRRAPPRLPPDPAPRAPRRGRHAAACATPRRHSTRHAPPSPPRSPWSRAWRSWLEYIDEASGRPYYFNVHTKVTTWYKPTGGPAPPPSLMNTASNDCMNIEVRPRLSPSSDRPLSPHEAPAPVRPRYPSPALEGPSPPHEEPPPD